MIGTTKKEFKFCQKEQITEIKGRQRKRSRKRKCSASVDRIRFEYLFDKLFCFDK
jgi:hypothetical protein